MRAFDVKIRLADRVLRFQALGRCSCDVVCDCLEQFGVCAVCVKGVRHAAAR